MHTNSTAMALNMRTIREGCSLIDGVSMRSPAPLAPIQTDPPNIFTDLSGGIFVVGPAKLCLHDENLCLVEILIRPSNSAYCVPPLHPGGYKGEGNSR